MQCGMECVIRSFLSNCRTLTFRVFFFMHFGSQCVFCSFQIIIIIVLVHGNLLATKNFVISNNVPSFVRVLPRHGCSFFSFYFVWLFLVTDYWWILIIPFLISDHPCIFLTLTWAIRHAPVLEWLLCLLYQATFSPCRVISVTLSQFVLSLQFPGILDTSHLSTPFHAASCSAPEYLCFVSLYEIDGRSLFFSTMYSLEFLALSIFSGI